MPRLPQRHDKDTASTEETSPSDSRLRASGERVAWGQHLDAVIVAYAAHRALSTQQLLILKLYLDGKKDKEIADVCGCSGATIYEHWRRMAKKSGGSLKSDVIADFHRFLAGE